MITEFLSKKKEKINNNKSINDNKMKKEKEKKKETKNEPPSTLKNKSAKIKQFIFDLVYHSFSSIGVLVIVLCYVMVGALLFKNLEEHHELKMCTQGRNHELTNIITFKSKLINFIMLNMTNDQNEFINNNYDNNLILVNLFKDYRNQVLDNSDTYLYTGQNCDKVTRWNLASSFLFTLTLITTIGYGHIAPVTWEGQIFCISYATFGE
jgi:hypothetical protein